MQSVWVTYRGLHLVLNTPISLTVKYLSGENHVETLRGGRVPYPRAFI
jgi:hypothetical protein